MKRRLFLIAFLLAYGSGLMYAQQYDDVYYQRGKHENEDTLKSQQQTIKKAETASSDEKENYYTDEYDYEDYDGYYDSDSESYKYKDAAGNTYITNNYYYGDYYDDYSYSCRLKRYYSPYYGFSYYSPCYTGFYDDWYGWSFSVSWGWGYPYYYYVYRPWYWDVWYWHHHPWHRPWYAYGGYWSGYYHGYYDGYYHGYYDRYYYDYGYSSSYGGRGYYYGPQYKTTGTSSGREINQKADGGPEGGVKKTSGILAEPQIDKNQIKSVQPGREAFQSKPVEPKTRSQQPLNNAVAPPETKPIVPKQKTQEPVKREAPGAQQLVPQQDAPSYNRNAPPAKPAPRLEDNNRSGNYPPYQKGQDAKPQMGAPGQKNSNPAPSGRDKFQPKSNREAPPAQYQPNSRKAGPSQNSTPGNVQPKRNFSPSPSAPAPAGRGGSYAPPPSVPEPDTKRATSQLIPANDQKVKAAPSVGDMHISGVKGREN